MAQRHVPLAPPVQVLSDAEDGCLRLNKNSRCGDFIPADCGYNRFPLHSIASETVLLHLAILMDATSVFCHPKTSPSHQLHGIDNCNAKAASSLWPMQLEPRRGTLLQQHTVTTVSAN